MAQTLGPIRIETYRNKLESRYGPGPSVGSWEGTLAVEASPAHAFRPLSTFNIADKAADPNFQNPHVIDSTREINHKWLNRFPG